VARVRGPGNGRFARVKLEFYRNGRVTALTELLYDHSPLFFVEIGQLRYPVTSPQNAILSPSS
jgi:hypothetical protein